MCLVRRWNSGFLTKRTALWLSQKIDVGFICGTPILDSSCRNRITSLVAAHTKRYLASVMKSVVHVCLFIAPHYGSIPKCENISCAIPLPCWLLQAIDTLFESAHQHRILFISLRLLHEVFFIQFSIQEGYMRTSYWIMCISCVATKANMLRIESCLITGLKVSL